MHKSHFLKDKHLHYKYPELLSTDKRIYCSPMLLGIGFMVASTAVSAYGQYQAGIAQDRYYKYLAMQNEEEAKVALRTGEERTTIAQNEAAKKAQELKGIVATTEGTQKAAMAAMGIAGVSAEDILSDTVNKAKLDEANIRYNADITSWMAQKEARETAWSLRNQSTLFRYAGRAARSAAMINMTSTLLGGASSIIGGGLKFPLKKGGISNIYTGSDFGGFTPSNKLKGFNWSPNILR